jgi:hypothetical protein
MARHLLLVCSIEDKDVHSIVLSTASSLQVACIGLEHRYGWLFYVSLRTTANLFMFKNNGMLICYRAAGELAAKRAAAGRAQPF